MKLDRAKAEAAVGQLAAKLRTGLVEAAYAIHTTTNHNMINAIEDITVNEGIDPRESYLISGGGATACHIAEMARILGIKRYMVPKLAAGLSAYGGLLSDVRWKESATLHQTSRDFDPARVARPICRLRSKGDAFLAQMGFEPAKRASNSPSRADISISPGISRWLSSFPGTNSPRGIWPSCSPPSTAPMSASTPSRTRTTWWSSRPGRCAPSAIPAVWSPWPTPCCIKGVRRARARNPAARSISAPLWA